MNTPGTLHDNVQLALDTILRKPTTGLPSFIFHVLKHSYIERLAGVSEGNYKREPIGVYRKLQESVGTCLIDHECSMDFPKLSAWKTRDGQDLVMFAGLSSTDGLLRLGTPQQIRDRLKWLVASGPRIGLFLSAMGIYPDMPWENVKTYVESIQYYRKHGRKGL